MVLWPIDGLQPLSSFRFQSPNGIFGGNQSERMSKSTAPADTPLSFEDFKAQVVQDYRIATESRQASLLGRKEVLTGKAKFGIFGDGKEVAQIAMARTFLNGDIRSGYYRDQTFMFASGLSDVQKFFAQLYAHTDVEAEPASAGRLMNGHFATRFLHEDGSWKNLTEEKHSTSDISPTAGQMGRALGIAYASKLFRENEALHGLTSFSKKGNEVSFVTIGNASASEGHFWETINAAGVLQVPLAVSVWDDGYGISVPASYQTTKENIGEILSGFSSTQEKRGYSLYTVAGWDYPALVAAYEKGIMRVRELHEPCIFHVTELTQPQGHSTSGSHERYKSKERLVWEQEFDCLRKMRQWIEAQGIATSSELDEIEQEATVYVKNAQKAAWLAFRAPIEAECKEALALMETLASKSAQSAFIQQAVQVLNETRDFIRKDVFNAVRRCLRLTRGEQLPERESLKSWLEVQIELNQDRYSSHLFSQSSSSALKQEAISPTFDADAPQLNGFEILNKAFDLILEREPRFFAIGEDVGQIGDVNQGFSGLQQKHGELRVTDTGIREMTIVGQGLGAALRGLRPLVEIQYLDYLLYAIQIMSDDIATLQYRTKGGQKAPLIIRTRGHRLEGIWHSGSPIGMILHAVRGMHVLVPRDMTRAAGFYNTLLKSDEPALVIECLNGYRLKETLPSNLGEFSMPLGKVEVVESGEDLTLVTYGSCVRIAQEAAKQLAELGISIEIVDCQSLLPFDLAHDTLKSIRKTNRLLILDEDVEGGATGFLMQQILEVQGAFRWLDSAPSTLSACPHRPAYGTDGDYFSKPSVDDVVEKVYRILAEAEPGYYPAL